MSLESTYEKAVSTYKKNVSNNLVPLRSGDMPVFYLVGGKVETVNTYQRCRGFMYDYLRRKVYSCKKGTKPLMLNKRYFYLYYPKNSKGGYSANSKITPSTIRLTFDFCKRLGYGEPDVFKRDGSYLIRLDMKILKDLYATSLLFLLYKHPAKAEGGKTFEDFVKAFFVGQSSTKVIKIMNGWSKIFPKVGWRTIFNADFGLHDQGITELYCACCGFPVLNELAKKILA